MVVGKNEHEFQDNEDEIDWQSIEIIEPHRLDKSDTDRKESNLASQIEEQDRKDQKRIQEILEKLKGK